MIFIHIKHEKVLYCNSIKWDFCLFANIGHTVIMYTNGYKIQRKNFVFRRCVVMDMAMVDGFLKIVMLAGVVTLFK